MVKNKEPEVCTPKIINGVLTFETSRFILNGKICDIISVNANPHEITFKIDNKPFTYTAENLIKVINKNNAK